MFALHSLRRDLDFAVGDCDFPVTAAMVASDS
jgi:hypothetical protein